MNKLLLIIYALYGFILCGAGYKVMKESYLYKGKKLTIYIGDWGIPVGLFMIFVGLHMLIVIFKSFSKK